jgi:DNA gyrase/topoisomerase IV subunit B
MPMSAHGRLLYRRGVTEHGYCEQGPLALTVLTMAESVRRRPGMYFGVGPGDPRLATQVLCAVVGHAVHLAAKVAAGHAAHVVADVTADLAFTVTDDQADLPTGQDDTPRYGYEESLLTNDRWVTAATAAVSSQTIVEVWQDGRGFRQTLVGLRPVEPAQAFSAPTGAGTRVAHILDPDFFGSAIITTDLADLDPRGPHCVDAVGLDGVLIRDHRGQGRPAEYRYT